MATVSEYRTWAQHLKDLSAAWAHAVDVLVAAEQMAVAAQQKERMDEEVKKLGEQKTALLVDIETAKTAADTAHQERLARNNKEHQAQAEALQAGIHELERKRHSAEVDHAVKVQTLNKEFEALKAGYELETTTLVAKRNQIKEELNSLLGRMTKSYGG
jgi:hypothetical protein